MSQATSDRNTHQKSVKRARQIGFVLAIVSVVVWYILLNKGYVHEATIAHVFLCLGIMTLSSAPLFLPQDKVARGLSIATLVFAAVVCIFDLFVLLS
jgi:FtsH-binding integral membrane protein